MRFATLDHSRIKGGTAIGWCWWPDSRGETLTTIRGCKWAKYFDAGLGEWVYFGTCENCYAQNTAHSQCTRFDSPHYRGLTKKTKRGPIWTGKIRFDQEQLLGVLRMKAPRTFFLTSMGDLFYEEVSDDIIAQHFAVMIATQDRHRFLILTKRPDRMAKLLNDEAFHDLVRAKAHALGVKLMKLTRIPLMPDNIWFGTSIESKPSAAWALNELMKVRASGRLWVSYEPMMEYVDLTPWLRRGLAWVVLGGASKQSATEPWPFQTWDAERVLDDCERAGVAFHLKQLGARPFAQLSQCVAGPLILPEHNNHNADPQHWPVKLRVQQFPVAA